MLNYNEVLKNISLYNLTEVERKYLSIFFENIETKENKEREERENFRKDCIEKYKRCIITNVFYKECDACHIVPYSVGLNNVNNSILLTKNLHGLFDDGFWTIDAETGDILISPEIENEETTIHLYKNKNLNHILNEELSRNLEWHYNNIFKKY